MEIPISKLVPSKILSDFAPLPPSFLSLTLSLSLSPFWINFFYSSLCETCQATLTGRAYPLPGSDPSQLLDKTCGFSRASCKSDGIYDHHSNLTADDLRTTTNIS